MNLLGSNKRYGYRDLHVEYGFSKPLMMMMMIVMTTMMTMVMTMMMTMITMMMMMTMIKRYCSRGKSAYRIVHQ